MDNQNKLFKSIKTVAGVAFAIAFVMAIVIFGNIGRAYISVPTAKLVFISAGGVALILNLITFQTGKFHPIYNLTYWLGSIIIFVGLIFNIMHWPYAIYILMAGMLGVAISFFLPKSMVEKHPQDSELLDN